MTDKQIIIDGCDVSGCEFYSYIESNKYPHRCSCYEDMFGCSVVCNLADCCKNCYYKQLKRKEQECEALGQAYLETNELLQEKTKECTNLKAENEEWKKANDCILTTLNVIAEGNKKLRQTLAEIKEIAEENKETAQYRGVCLSILQKISEVENENN